MSDDAMRAALREAQRALCNLMTHGDCTCDAEPGRACSCEDAGRIVVAFLRALPPGLRGVPHVVTRDGAACLPHRLAAAVERAATEAGR